VRPCTQLTVLICPGSLVHSMGKITWRNDNGEECFFTASLDPADSNVISVIW
jgi:hypothetical protein